VILTSIADCLHPLPNNAVNELRIRQACFAGCEGEVFVVSEDRVRVCFDEIEFVLGRETQIDSRVAVDGQQR